MLELLFFAWQTALQLLAGDEEKLLQLIPILIGCTREDILEGKSIQTTKVRGILHLMKETAFSHLIEVNGLFIMFALITLMPAQNFTEG